MTDYLRALMTYIVPLIVVGGIIFCGLWIVPDTLFGMYANVDGKWMSWNHRNILEWSSFLNFGPFSPFSGAGSLFLPNLPWLNPGAMALGIPAPIEYKHLFSYFVYLAELTLSLYLLFLELKIDRAYAFTAVLLYVAFFFPPFNSISGVPSWFSLGPFIAHQAATMNLATVALLRSGRTTFRWSLVWGVVFVVCLFSAFSSAPMFNLIYIPVYALLWTLLAFSTQADRHALPFRIGLVLFTVAVFWSIGLFGYMSVTAAISARDINVPPFLHPGMALLTVDYWAALISQFSVCSGRQSAYLICPSIAPAAWVQIAALLGGAVTIALDRGRPRAFAITVVAMIGFLHFYVLIADAKILGPVQVVSYPYIYWTLLPLVFGVAVAGTATVARLTFGSREAAGAWIPGVANCGISIALLVLFVSVIYVRQPRLAGEGVLGFRPIAHTPVRSGAIHRYLEEHIAVRPGEKFRGYAGLYLDPDEGFVRKSYPVSTDANSHEIYVHARGLLAEQFGNMFQLTDLWNSNIPTIEDYGHWLTWQLFVFNRDLLAASGDTMDPMGVATHVYRVAPNLLAMLGVRYIVSDATVNSPLVTEVLHETSAAGTSLRLYEIRNANLGNLSPAKVIVANGYGDAVTRLRDLQGQDTMVVIGPAALPSDAVAAHGAVLSVNNDGYHVEARSAGTSLLVLPVQFSHCWRLVGQPAGKASIFRANIIQTGIEFQGSINADLRFEFGLLNAGCRRQDADDMRRHFPRSRSGLI